MEYFGTTINDSPVIAGTLASAVEGQVAFKAVAFDENGALTIATDSTVPVGIATPDAGEDRKAGDEITVQVTAIGIAVAGGAIKRGDALAAGEGGKLVKATSGKFILGFALTDATAGNSVTVQITKSGYAA